MSPVNLAAFVGVLAVRIGYTFYADSAARTRSLMGAASRHRALWMEAMPARDNRTVDAAVVATLARSVLFFAQTSIFIIAGRLAAFGDLAVDHFNRGIRGYYFGLAVLSWFIDPWQLMATTLWVVAVLWRREFRSDTLSATSQ